MPDFRPVPDEDTADFRALVQYAFRPQSGPFDPEEADEEPDASKIGRRYGVYDGDDLVSVCKHVDFSVRVRGDYHDMHGLSAVASPPEHRRQGYVRELLRESLTTSREEDVYLSALWPFKRSFYANFGWGTCSRMVSHELDPETLAFARGHADGELVPLDGDDWERMDTVHDADAADLDLTTDRTEEWWRKRVCTGWEDDPYVYGLERDGDLAAYLTYRFDSDGDDRTLNVGDWAAVDHNARLAVFEFLADHDSQVDAVSFWTGEYSDALDLLPDESDATVELALGPMVRLVDVPDALEALSFLEDATADLVLSVTDSLADWNDDTYRLVVERGDATVERTDADPDAELGVRALSQLYVGYRSADELATVGDIEAGEEAVAALGDLFPERKTLLREGF
jgi:predicted acetyltransferase